MKSSCHVAIRVVRPVDAVPLVGFSAVPLQALEVVTPLNTENSGHGVLST